MKICRKSPGFAVIIVATAISVAKADPIDHLRQIAQAGGAAAAITLPEVVVHPDGWYYRPYTNGRSQKASSLNHSPLSHFKVPVGYDADVGLHPYTSGLGPCTEAAQPSQGCRHDTGHPILPSHYERAPFNQ